MSFFIAPTGASEKHFLSPWQILQKNADRYCFSKFCRCHS